MTVDMAARICHLEYQTSGDWQKIHDFVIKYQDRLLYGSDLGAEVNSNPVEVNRREHSTWVSDWKFFAANETRAAEDFQGTFKGLHLPKEVIDKIYRQNAQKWFP